MKKIDVIKAHYLQQGVTEDNLLYAVDAVKAGTKREHIPDNLTADYRGMDPFIATRLLEELFDANGVRWAVSITSSRRSPANSARKKRRFRIKLNQD